MIRPGGKAEMMARVVPSTFRNGFYAGLIVALSSGFGWRNSGRWKDRCTSTANISFGKSKTGTGRRRENSWPPTITTSGATTERSSSVGFVSPFGFFPA
jgi:hypothetical protein